MRAVLTHCAMRSVVVGLLALSLAVPSFASSTDPGIGKPPVRRTFCGRKIAWARRHRLLAGALLLGVTIASYGGAEALVREPAEVTTKGYDPRSLGQGGIAINVFGDSMSQGSDGYDAILPGALEARTTRGGWPTDRSTTPGSIDSVFKRLRAKHGDAASISVRNSGSSGAYIDPAINQSNWMKRNIFLVNDLQKQVDNVLSLRTFPNVHLWAIGAPNLDWAYDVKQYGLDEATYLNELPNKTADALETQLRLVAEKGRQQKYPVALVVYAQPDLRSAIRLRAQALAIHETDKSRFPHALDPVTMFPSFNPEFQERTFALADRQDEAFEARVKKLQTEYAGTNVSFFFSRAIRNVEWRDLSELSYRDALHPAPKAKSRIAQSVLDDLETTRVLDVVRFRP